MCTVMPVFEETSLDQRQIVGRHPVEKRRKSDSVVGDASLFAECRDSVGALPFATRVVSSRWPTIPLPMTTRFFLRSFMFDDSWIMFPT